MGEKRNCLGRYEVSLKHPDFGPWDDTRLGACEPESYLIQTTRFTPCSDQKLRGLTWCEPRPRLLGSKLQPNAPPPAEQTPMSVSANRHPRARSNAGCPLPPSCNSGKILRLHPRPSPSSIRGGYRRPFVRGDSAQRATRGGRFALSIPHLQAGGTGGTCPVDRGRINTGKWQLSFCLTCFGRNSWGYYRN